MPDRKSETFCLMIDSGASRTLRICMPANALAFTTTEYAVLRELAERKSDGIIHVSTGGGAIASGCVAKGHGARRDRDSPENVHRAGERYPVTSRCHRRLLASSSPDLSYRRRANGETAGRGPAESFHRSHVRREQSRVARKSRDFREAVERFTKVGSVRSKPRPAQLAARRTMLLVTSLRGLHGVRGQAGGGSRLQAERRADT